jgi:hypothetical protein
MGLNCAKNLDHYHRIAISANQWRANEILEHD